MSNRILLISPKTFGYEVAIRSELESMRYEVDWYDERPTTSAFAKAIIRFNPGLIKIVSDAYFNKIINEVKHKEYEIVFIIKGEALSEKCLKELKMTQPCARFLYYTWDSMTNFRNGEKKLPYFEKRYSFDRSDCEQNPSVKHLPLFYQRHFAQTLKSGDAEIDLLFLGTIHADRYSVVSNIMSVAKGLAPTLVTKNYFYYQSKWVFAIRKIVDKNFRMIPWSEVKWKPLSPADTLKAMIGCKIMIDVQHPAQTGLTMRTIECIGAEVKLITTNKDVVNYDFFRPENILVIDRSFPVIPKDFVLTRYKKLPSDLYEKYSIKNWLSEILAT